MIAPKRPFRGFSIRRVPPILNQRRILAELRMGKEGVGSALSRCHRLVTGVVPALMPMDSLGS